MALTGGGGRGSGDSDDGETSRAVSDEKSRLRGMLLEKRDKTSAEYLGSAARRISDAVLACPEIAGACAVGAYSSIRSEVPTSRIIRGLLAAGKSLYMPRVTSSMDMEFCAIRSESELVPGGVIRETMEPAGGVSKAMAAAVAPEDMDAIIVPAVAMSRDGHRLGYGRGYYDRFLARCRTDVFKAAPVLGGQVIDKIPAGPHDVRMDAIITEFGVSYMQQ